MDLYYWLWRGGLSIATFIMAKILYWFLNGVIDKLDSYAEARGLEHLDIEDSTKKMISQVSKYFIYGLAFIIVLYIFDLNELLMGVVTAAGVSGIAIGFAAKDLISNALSGIILVFDRPFKIGDCIKVGRFIDEGVVKKISIRSTVLRTSDGEVITVPNSQILNSHVVNLSTFPINPVHLQVEIDVDSKVKKAIQLIDAYIDKLEWKADKPRSQVSILDVNKDDVILDLKVWTKSEQVGQRKTELFYEIRDLLKKNRIKSSVLRQE